MKSTPTAQTSSIKPTPNPDSFVKVSTDSLMDSLLRIQDGYPLEALPLPRLGRFNAYVLYRVAEAAADGSMAHLSAADVLKTMARRELREWFTLHPRWAWIHRKLQTKRWVFARDGVLGDKR